MSRATRIILVLVGLLLVAVIAAAIFLVVTVRRPFPQADGRLTIPGLQEEVQIYRDDWGVPHIYAQNEADLFFAQGYVHAQDRFWQMEFWRHIGRGRISEIAGESTVDSDKFIRTMGWNRLAENTLDYYVAEEPEIMAVLDAYSAGVNAYVDANRDALSINYDILGLVNEPWEIEPWQPIDTIAWSIVMADDLSGNWSAEIRRADLIKELGEAMVDTLIPGYPYERRPLIVPDEALDLDGEVEDEQSSADSVDWSRVDTAVIDGRPDLGFALGIQPWVGSNNWVIAGEHTESGAPLLANDPHLGIQMPAIWYEIGLHGGGYNVTGFSFAGVPGVILGHNDQIAWGVTNVGPDVQDLYIEKINPNNPRQYEYEGEWQEMEVVEEVIKVNGGEDVVLEVLVTRHGPIINEVVDGTNDVLALRWTAQEPSRLVTSLLSLNRAANYDEFRDALRTWDVPSQNFVYADVEGNIAYQMPGLIPIRANGDGLTPVPGWTAEYEWDGWIPYDDLPALFNPESGYIVTANNAVVSPDYPYLLSYYWADGDRAQRITEMIESELDGDGEVSIEDIARIQFDSKSLLAESYIPLMEGLTSDDAQVQAALERLRGWDLQTRRGSVPAALFEVFRVHLETAVLADEVGQENAGRAGNLVFFHSLAGDRDAAWWDDTATEAVETSDEIILEALAQTVEWFEDNVGGDMNDWTWGSIHTATFVSNPVGVSGVDLIEGVVNRGPFPADGTSSAVNNTGWSYDDPAVVRGHPSMRAIYSLADFDDSVGILPTGQSGHPYHPHYDDMMPLWLDGEYHPMLYSREIVEEAAVDTLILQPEEAE